MRFGPVATAVAIATATATAVPAAAPAAAPADEATPFTLTRQTNWVPPDGTALLELRVPARPAAGLGVEVTVHRAVASRTAYAEMLSGEDLGAVAGRVAAPLDTLPVAPSGDRVLAIGVKGESSPPDPGRALPGRSGVYPVELALVASGGKALSRFVTPVVVIAPGLVPLTLAWVWPLGATPARAPDGDLRAEAGRAFSGRLESMVAAAAAQPDVALTLAPVPESLEAWASTNASTAGPTQGELPAGVRKALAGGNPARQVLGGPYVPVPVSTLVSAGLAPEFDHHWGRGAAAYQRLLGYIPSAGTYLAGALDDKGLSRLRQQGVERVVLNPSTLEPFPNRLTPARPFLLAAGPRPLRAATADAGLADILTGKAPPHLRAARFLGALSLVALEAPRQARGVVVVMPPTWDPDAALLDAVLGGLASHPAIRPATLDRYFEAVPTEESDDGSIVTRRLAPPDAPGPAPIDGTALSTTRRRLDSFAQLLPESDPRPALARRALLLAQSTPVVAAGGAAPEDYRREAERQIAVVTGAVKGPDGQRVTLTSRRATIPISLLNTGSVPLSVLVRLESDHLEFPAGKERLVTLGPRNTTENFAVEVRASGSFPLRIFVTSPDGKLAVNHSEVTIRSTAVSGVGALLAAGAGIFLLLWWGNDLRRARHRRRHART